jgi:GntR family transcriptional regulator
MLPFEVIFRSGEPVYEQVMYAVKKAVATGQLSAGSKFPAVRTLSQELRINPNTAHKIVAALTAQGVLDVHPGVGTVVAAPAEGSGEDRAALLNDDLERLVVESRRIGLSEDEVTAALRRHWKKLSKNS